MRPWLWCSWPRFGQFATVEAYPWGITRRDDGRHLLPAVGCWLLVSTSIPSQPVATLPGGCFLWIDPASALVWSFHDGAAYSDDYVSSDAGGYVIRLRVWVTAAVAGMVGYVQLVTVGPGDDAWRTSTVVRVALPAR